MKFLKDGTLSRVAQLNGFTPPAVELLSAYNSPNRHYHNEAHIVEMIDFVNKYRQELSMSHDDFRALVVAILFHDIVYDVHSKTNEEDSVKVFKQAVSIIQNKQDREYWEKQTPTVERLIMLTADHEINSDTPVIDRAMVLADLNRFATPDFGQFWGYTLQLFKEYAFVDFAVFKEGRIKFLQSYADKIRGFHPWMPAIAAQNIEQVIPVLMAWQPKIAVYPGSFNPFHIGHLNILQKAEAIFDKVIIALGKNPGKDYSNRAPLPKLITDNYQVEAYEGYLTDYLASKSYPLTVIRGLRNSTDLQHEVEFLRFLQEDMPDVRMVSIIPDRVIDHVSSSGIKLYEMAGRTSKNRVQE